MNTRLASLWVGMLPSRSAAGIATASAQQRVLRLTNPRPAGSILPRSSDYAASVLLMNAYDTLVQADPKARRGAEPRHGWTISEDGKSYTSRCGPT